MLRMQSKSCLKKAKVVNEFLDRGGCQIAKNHHFFSYCKSKCGGAQREYIIQLGISIRTPSRIRFGSLFLGLIIFVAMLFLML